jgi:chemotaxis protein methyltransferase CheR
MWPGAETLEFSGSVFTIMRDLIRENTGQYYDDSRREVLAEKLSDRVRARGFRSFIDYY